MAFVSIKDLIVNKKIGFYKVGYKDKEVLLDALYEAKESKLLHNKGLSYSLTFHDGYIAFCLYQSIDNLIIN